MRFLELIESKRAKAQADARAAYKRLVRLAAEAGDLGDEDAQALDAAAESIGKAHADIEADVLAIREATEAEAIAAGMTEAQVALRSAKRAESDFTLRYQQTQAALVSEREALERATGKALTGVTRCSQAEQRLKDLRRNHPELFV